MTIRQILKKHHQVQGLPELICSTIKQPQEFLFLEPSYKLSKIEQTKLDQSLTKRKQGVPLAYILGYKFFYGHKFVVNKNVLIPRPETEGLVDFALDYVKKTNLKRLRILDLATGSGCVGLSVALKLTESGFKHFTLTCSDISNAALTVAKKNAKNLQVKNTNFIQSDLFKNIHSKYDIILANLPYIPLGLYELLRHSLKYEPKIAITDNSENWDIYKKFFQAFSKHLTTTGVAILEIDDCSKADLIKLFEKSASLPKNYKLNFKKDLGGRWRYLSIKKS